MPSQFDNTYHYYFSQPTFDTEADKKFYETKREFETIFEADVPQVPTREMELEYLDFLQKSFTKDPWATYRFRKYMASPKRIPWSNYRELKLEARKIWYGNMLLASLLFYPVACMIGRAQKVTAGGVPVYPITRFVHNWPNVQVFNQSKKTFRKFTVISSLAVGYVYAYIMTDDSAIRNEWFNRPDFKPYAAMVKKEGLVKEQEDALMEKLYPWRYGWDYKRNPFYRFMFPEKADWSIKQNPYSKMDNRDVWHYSKGTYESWTNDFADHLPH